jgi:hypothetical protein
MIQALTDAINILLIDRGLDSYVNKFSLHMQEPVTQEELDKRDALSSEIALAGDVMNMLDGIEDPILKLKITKSLISNIISNQEVIGFIQEQIEALEEAAEEEAKADLDSGSNDIDLDISGDIDFGGDDFASDFESGLDSGTDFTDDFGTEDLGGDIGGEELPSPSDLGGGIDFTEM